MRRDDVGRRRKLSLGSNPTSPQRPCHYRAIHGSPDRSPADTHGQPHSGLDLCHPRSAEVTTQADLALKQGVGGSRLALVLPASCSRRPSSCTWFEPTRGWGITMPLTRDSPSIQGDVPGPDPAGAPPNKAIAQAGLACRGQPAGVYLASQGPPSGAPLPPRAGVPRPRRRGRDSADVLPNRSAPSRTSLYHSE